MKKNKGIDEMLDTGNSKLHNKNKINNMIPTNEIHHMKDKIQIWKI